MTAKTAQDKLQELFRIVQQFEDGLINENEMYLGITALVWEAKLNQ